MKEKFNPSEPGISHPLTECAVRLTDDGRIVLMAGEHAGIVVDEVTGVIALYGSEVCFVTEAVRINGARINEEMLLDSLSSKDIGRQLRMIDKAKE